MGEAHTHGKNGRSTVTHLLVPYTFAAWLGFLAIGIPLPVLSLFAHDRLGYDPLVVSRRHFRQRENALRRRQGQGCR